ncbi:site-2 protease family protein [Paenibacillus sp. GCM10023252]|uniref:site-2 protease family protein n=1 Tax=Paenibacillus sp. GCM10023252 TaxID=3252649 RepID=UPI0036194F28
MHEFAHAYTAYKFGDPTAYDQGRVTLNPRVHLDVFGTILILIAGFGWARPVPVKASNFKNPRLMSIIVSAVGPVSNLILAVLSILSIYILNETGLLHAGSRGVYAALIHFFYYMWTINMLLFFFNLIPLPPLDGFRIVHELLPLETRIKVDQNLQWGMFIFLLLVFIPPLRAATLDPYLGLSVKLTSSIFAWFGHFFTPLGFI